MELQQYIWECFDYHYIKDPTDITKTISFNESGCIYVNATSIEEAREKAIEMIWKHIGSILETMLMNLNGILIINLMMLSYS
jgi:hypothetical protein